jgi:hypothetical protein
MPERELLRNVAAHRQPEDVRGPSARRLHHRRRIIGHRRDRVRTWWDIAPANAAIVEDDDAVARRQRRADARPPLESCAEAHDQQQRLAGAFLLPP